MKTFAQLAAAFIVAVEACAPDSETGPTFDCENAGDVCQFTISLTTTSGDSIYTPIVLCIPADADQAAIEAAIQGVSSDILTWTTPITFTQDIIDQFTGEAPSCTEEDASCLIPESVCVKRTVVSVPAEGDELYSAYELALALEDTLVPGNVGYECILDAMIEDGTLPDTESIYLGNYGVALTFEVYGEPAEDFAAKLALSATAALAVASLF